MHANVANDAHELIHPELSYRLTGLFYAVHNGLGRNLLEKQYADGLEVELKRCGIPYRREVRVSIRYRDSSLPAGTADFVIDNKIAVDIKAKKFITKEDYQQILRYLKAKNFRLGMIVNFRSSYLKPKRILNSDLH
ncbi:MAG: GxxExxY protein [Patescibacteria group bacterium]